MKDLNKMTFDKPKPSMTEASCDKAVDNILHLYHGSKSGLKGTPKPKSRKICDFGSGLYLGDNPNQPKSLISRKGFTSSVLYDVQLDLSNLTILDLRKDNRMWCLFVAYNRKAFDCTQYPRLMQIFYKYENAYDVIIGPIADDKMTLVLDRFLSNLMTDVALYNALNLLSRGNLLNIY